MVVCCISASAHELVDILSAVLRAVEGRDVEMTSILTEKEPPQLIIIDSISALLAPVLTTSARGHALMMSIATALRTLTREHNVIIITTNGVTKMHKNANYKSALGTSWIEVADTRITLQEPADTSQAIGVTQIEANVITSNRIQPKKGGIFQISGAGIT
ncbi:hypothetical protein SARC_00198 [Sphaeroforma arctica JP610]|uniref:RecA family profile 1 domain-containing protein n=2 Tax=Sphaeroforma arctica JP610 TaxID=667725 RepID=A0A0L0GFS8_9EUKA|nr:hypothetical protein SARC_00198 [Sphaeroforma arctica JP610]KNC87691.1 hypothetical protein SARC_00198 [Sphaeroforma arctica JP610]|eukprot:XP_014161593.1 hypothetical protein SARC_00198 [Sphaeroforma arctica JP610]